MRLRRKIPLLSLVSLLLLLRSHMSLKCCWMGTMELREELGVVALVQEWMGMHTEKDVDVEIVSLSWRKCQVLELLDLWHRIGLMLGASQI